MAARHDPVEAGVHILGPVFAQPPNRGSAAESGQRLGAEPSIGGKWRSGRNFDPAEDLQHLAQANLRLACPSL